jgi:hypothetical protein
MIPVAEQLLKMNFNVFIGSGNLHMALFRNETPGLRYIDFEGFRPNYSRFLPQYLALLLRMPSLIYHIVQEHIRLKKIIRENEIDIVISDNRFGLWNSDITSVYITHMPLIPFPEPMRFLEFIGVFLHRIIIKKYSLCFIPDLPGIENLTGRLSHGLRLPGNVRYTGILSRFNASDSDIQSSTKTDGYNTAVLSGPEPQRSMLRKKIVNLFCNQESDLVILEGKPGKNVEEVKSGNITSYNHLPGSKMKGLLKKSTGIICRSGYSTIMDLVSLNCSALLIPTPGQTEQEYLARYLSGKGWFSFESQENLGRDIKIPGNSALWSPDLVSQSKELLESALKELSDYKHKKK